jgi:Papain family cysteine protease
MKLSEQEILDCAEYPYKVGDGCDGASDTWTYKHLKVVNGTTMNFNLPYENTDQNQCVLNRPKVPESAVVDFVALTPYDEENMKYHLATVGPIAVTIWMAPSFLRYKSGIYEDTLGECAGRTVNHGVLIVGYGSAPCNGRDSCDYWFVEYFIV